MTCCKHHTRNTKKRVPINPLRTDPSRTGTLRRAFAREFRKRLACLKQDIRNLIVEEDAFGIAPSPFGLNVFCPTGEGGGVDPSCSPGNTFTTGPSIAGDKGETIRTAGGRIDVQFVAAPYAPRKQSIIDFVVDEDKRGQGIGDRLLKKAMEKYTDIGAQVSSVASLKVFHNNGFRNPDMPKGSFAEHKAEFDANGGSLFVAQNDKGGKPYVERPTQNVFCPTGPGGGVDPSCSPGGGQGAIKVSSTAGREEWNRATIPADQAEQLVAKIRAGNATSKNKGSLSPEGRTPPLVLTEIPLSLFTPDTRQFIDETTDKARVVRYAGQKIDTPIYAQPKRPGKFGGTGWQINDGGHRLMAAIQRGDTTIPALVPASAYDVLHPSDTRNTRFAFRTTAEKVEAFRKWLARQAALRLIGDNIRERDAWWYRFAEDGYRRGAGMSFDDSKKAYAKGYAEDESTRDFYDRSKYEFLRDSFAKPVAVEKLKLMSGRVFTELEGITADMSRKLTRTLTDGLARGAHPYDISRKIVADISDIDRTRADRLARTEIMRVHAEGQLDALEELGVTEIGVMVEWSTSGLGVTEKGNPSPCPICAAMLSVVVTPQEARGMLPRHPNCLCVWKPANVGERTDEQVRTRGRIQAAVQRSVMAEGKGSYEARLKKTTWQGADVEIAKTRPKGVFNRLDFNVFCPTGPGGGVDPTCSPGSGKGGSAAVSYKSPHGVSYTIQDKRDKPLSEAEITRVKETFEKMPRVLQEVSLGIEIAKDTYAAPGRAIVISQGNSGSLGIMLHEAGHMLQAARTKGPEWMRIRDQEYPNGFGDAFAAAGMTDLKPTGSWPGAISEYTRIPSEDFAESVKYYAQGRVPPGMEPLGKTYRDVFPKRAAFLDRLFVEGLNLKEEPGVSNRRPYSVFNQRARRGYQPRFSKYLLNRKATQRKGAMADG